MLAFHPFDVTKRKKTTKQSNLDMSLHTRHRENQRLLHRTLVKAQALASAWVYICTLLGDQLAEYKTTSNPWLANYKTGLISSSWHDCENRW